MLLFSSPNYVNLPLIIGVLSLLTLAGVLLFLKVNFRFVELIVFSEILISIISYHFVFKFITIPIIVVFMGLLLFGLLTSLLPEISLIVYVALTVLILYKTSIPFFGTDEIMIVYYSAYLFLHGLNPYIPANTANVYNVYGSLAPPFNTPLTTGGVVTNLNYPSLSFLIQIPAEILHVSPNYTLIFFFLATIILYYFILRKQNSIYLYPLFISAMYFNPNYLYYPRGGVPDIIWVFFLSISLFVKDVRLKGIFYGISVAVKQISLLLFPFILIYLYKEKASLLKFLSYSSLIFLIFNGYFIIISPTYYFYDILYPVIADLIGIGVGPSILAFNGIFYIYKTFFMISIVIVTALEIFLFITWYNKFKNVWTSFPYFILFMGYRVLWNYLMYWPFFSFIDKQTKNNDDPEEEGNKTRVYGAIIITALLLVSLGFYYHLGYTPYYDSIHIKVIKIVEKNGLICSIILNVSYIPTSSKLPKAIYPNFRIFPDEPMITANGLLWNSNVSVIPANSWSIVKLEAPNNLVFRPMTFEIQIYYGDLMGAVIVDPIKFLNETA